MPRYDIRCLMGHEAEIVTRWDDTATPCPRCGEATVRVWKQSASVRGDDIPGGFYDDHAERWFYTKSAHDQYLKANGWERKVRHVGGKGSDKSALTQRWDICPAALIVPEVERLRQWHAWDRLQGLSTSPDPARPAAIVAPDPEPVFTPAEHRELCAVAAQVGL